MCENPATLERSAATVSRRRRIHHSGALTAARAASESVVVKSACVTSAADPSPRVLLFGVWESQLAEVSCRRRRRRCADIYHLCVGWGALFIFALPLFVPCCCSYEDPNTKSAADDRCRAALAAAQRVRSSDNLRQHDFRSQIQEERKGMEWKGTGRKRLKEKTSCWERQSM